MCTSLIITSCNTRPSDEKLFIDYLQNTLHMDNKHLDACYLIVPSNACKACIAYPSMYHIPPTCNKTFIITDRINNDYKGDVLVDSQAVLLNYAFAYAGVQLITVANKQVTEMLPLKLK